MASSKSTAVGPTKERHVAGDAEPSRADEAASEASADTEPPSADFAAFARRVASRRPPDPAEEPISVARVAPRAIAPSAAPRVPASIPFDPHVEPPPSPRQVPRFFLLALTFAAGVAAGGVGLYLLHADLPVGFGRFEPRRAPAPTANAGHALGSRSDAASAAPAPVGPTDISALTAMFERQLAAGRLDQPSIDNALETYRQIAAAAPQDPATTRLGERLAAALWARGNEARAAKRWDNALHDFALLKALPPIPWQMLAAKLDTMPAHAAPDASPTAASPPPSPAASATASATPSDGAPATASTGSDVAAVFMARGDGALQQGDVISARQFYELAAANGLARAATAVGLTYDPDFLQARGVRGALADMTEARRWYRKAIDAGDPAARLRLDKLLTPAR
jgi:tetratricopeptide (TPR) repeat protein